MNITIYDNNGTSIASVVVGSTSYVFTKIMGENYLQLDFKSGEYIDIKRYSYVVYNGIKYTLLQDVEVEKSSTCEYVYSVRFMSPQEMLDNIFMSHMAGENQVSTKAWERNFSLAGTAQEHIDMLLRNTARMNVRFVRGSVDASLTGVKVVAYNNVTCKSALQLIANTFETEWWIDGNETNGYTINLGKCSFSENNPTRLAYGHDNGVLPGAKRNLNKDAQKMTHIAVQGGSQNINTLSQLPNVPPYQFSTLHLPLIVENAVNGVGHIYYDVAHNKFEGETGFVLDSSVLLTIDRNSNMMTSSLYTEGDVVVERAYDMSEYYPKKTRKTTAFGFQRNNTEFYIEDSTIESECNYKTYQLGGEKITIVFQTGALAGKTFDVIEYDHEHRRFECALADYDTISMPSVDIAMWRPIADAVNGGDEFIVYGTALPTTYFADRTTDPYSGAEWDMCRRAASILCENYNDKFAYRLPLDANWLSRRTAEERNRLKCGYWVHFVDNQLCGGGADIRITDVKVHLTRPLQPEITIGDEVKTYSVAQRLQQIQSNVSATYNYVKDVQEQTNRDLQQVQKETEEIIVPSEDVEHYKGRINITDLLALTQAEIGEDDMYLVYVSGNKTDGWSKGGSFVIAGETCQEPSFVQWIDGGWHKVTKEVDLTNYMRFNELPSVVSMIESTYADASYSNLYGDQRAGMPIAMVGNYKLDENGVYHPIFVEKGTAGQPYYSRNYTKTLFVPYARSYQQGGTTHYEGGALTAADYETFKNLASGGGGVTYTFQGGTNSFTVTPSNGQEQVVNVTPSITTDATPTANSSNPVQSGGVKTALDNKADASHTHSASDITSGVLAVERGGTGQATLEQACNSMITALRTDTSQNNVPLDGDYFVSQFRGGTYDTYFRRPMSALWAYIKSKADSVYAAISHTHTTSDITDFPTIPTDVVKYTSQTLATNQQAQARTNIGAGTSNLALGDTATTAAAGNHTHDVTAYVSAIGASDIQPSADESVFISVGGTGKTIRMPKSVLYVSQYLSTSQKAQARQNIGAGTSDFSGNYYDLTNIPTIYYDVVRYGTAQLLSESQKLTVRSNIGVGDVSFVKLRYNETDGWEVLDKSADIASVTPQQGNERLTLNILLVGLTSKSAVEEYLLARQVYGNYLYYDTDTNLISSRSSDYDTIKVAVIDNQYGIKYSRNASVFHTPEPYEYLTISFTHLYH